jgi:SAM-dependent methyltransferase
MTLLDVGSGYGRMERILSRLFDSVIGIDVSFVNLSRAANFNVNAGNCNLISGDGSTLSALKDSCLDLVISFTVSQHLPGAAFKNYLRESFRVPRLRGILRFQLIERWARARQIPFDLLRGKPRRGIGGVVNLLNGSENIFIMPPWISSAPLGKLYSIAVVKEFLRRIGFVDVTAHETGFLWISCRKTGENQ